MKKLINKIMCIILTFTTVFLFACGTPEIEEGPINQKTMVQSNDFSANTDYTAFLTKAKADFIIPGLAEGFIPQGMDVSEEKEIAFISGYFKSYEEHPSSMIITVDLKTGKLLGYYYLKKTNGDYCKSHVGGVAVTSKNLFIADGGKVCRIPLSQFETAQKGDTLSMVEDIKVPVMAAYCNYSNGILWVGDFYYFPQYDTRDYHDGLLFDNKYYGAWMVGYELDSTTESEFSTIAWNSESTVALPDRVIATTERIQGATFIGDKAVLSQSFGRINNSTILVYDYSLDSNPQTTVTIDGKEIPTWVLKDATGSYVAPPMSEGLAVYNNKVLILFESATASYIQDAINPTDHVWSFAV